MRGTPGLQVGSFRPALARLQVAALCVLALGVHLVAVWQLDPLVRWLWPIPVVMFVVYPYLKRVTWLCTSGSARRSVLRPWARGPR